MPTLTKTPYTAGSGKVVKVQTTSWATIRGGSSGDSVDDGDNFNTVFSGSDTGGARQFLNRLFAQFDISSLPTNISVTSATLSVDHSGSPTDGGADLVLAESTQPASTAIHVDHYNDITLNSPTELAARLDLTGIADPAIFTFNEAGKPRIEALASAGSQWLKLVVRDSNDVDNSGPSDGVFNRLHSTNSDNMSLVINYTIIGGSFLFNMI